MSAITTHVLDLAHGKPARGIPVRLELYQPGDGWVPLAERGTDDDGRVRDLLAPGSRLDLGIYRLTFLAGRYFSDLGSRCFYPEIIITFEVTEAEQHYHVPLLLSPWGYSTYRGS